MKTLQQLRDEIDFINSELSRIFLGRMEVALQVAQSKHPNAGAIYNPVREEEVLEKTLLHVPEGAKPYCRALFLSVMRYSREAQYRYMAENGVLPSYFKDIEKKEEKKEPLRVCYQGIDGSWSSGAARAMYKGAVYQNVEYFEDVFEAVESGKTDVGILPFENTTAGIINQVYDNLAKYNLYINLSFDEKIDNCLAAVEGAGLHTVKTVMSHPQALSQCSQYLRKHGYLEHPCLNTAVAAQEVSVKNDPALAAICSRDAAEKYGLKILDPDVNNEKGNSTRFIAVSKEMKVDSSCSRIGLAFTLPHISGSLAALVSLFSDCGLSINCIHSRPLPGKPWEYRFYLDFTGNLEDLVTASLLLQLEKELPSLKILGNYREMK